MRSVKHQWKLQLAPWALLTVAMSWGFSFVIMRDALERQSVTSFLFTRFSLAVVVMLLIRPKIFKVMERGLVLRGAVAGFFLGSGYIFQTFGLERTGAAITGFVTGLYVVLTPLLALIILHQRVSRSTWSCVAIATIGLGLLSIHGWSIGLGELLTFIGAIFFALHIIALSSWSAGRDAYAMTVVQLIVCSVLSGLASIPAGYSPPPDFGTWATVAFTAIFATAVAFIIQTWSQAHISATKVAVILTMEVVFAALFALVFGGERLSLQNLLGGAIVVSAMYLIVLKEER